MTDGWTDARADRRTDGRTLGRTDGRTVERTNGRTDGRTVDGYYIDIQYIVTGSTKLYLVLLSATPIYGPRSAGVSLRSGCAAGSPGLHQGDMPPGHTPRADPKARPKGQTQRANPKESSRHPQKLASPAAFGFGLWVWPLGLAFGSGFWVRVGGSCDGWPVHACERIRVFSGSYRKLSFRTQFSMSREYPV